MSHAKLPNQGNHYLGLGWCRWMFIRRSLVIIRSILCWWWIGVNFWIMMWHWLQWTQVKIVSLEFLKLKIFFPAVGDGGPSVDCSECDSRKTVSQSCFPVPIPDDDPVFGPSPTPGGLCFPFVRSQLGQLRLGEFYQLFDCQSIIDNR